MTRRIDLARAALAAWPAPEAFGRLAEALAENGDRDEAIATYRQGVAVHPDSPPLAINFARLLRQDSDGADEAVAVLRRVVAQAPDFAPAWMSLIETLRTAARRPDEAAAEARDYARRFPADANGPLALALALFDGAHFADALAAADCALARQNDLARAWELKATILGALGDAAGVMECYRQICRLAPDADTHSRLLMAMQYCDCIDEAMLLTETRNWVRRHTAGITPRHRWPAVEFAPERRLNVGLVSRDFRQSSLPYLSLPLFEHWPQEWSMTLYANVELPDEWTRRFQAMAGRWVDILPLDDDQAAARIEADGIDVLVDINGHTLGGRPGLFARKPAPVQLAWLDYVGTTGLAAIDAVIGDAGHLPPGDQPWYVEPIHRVSVNLYRYAPPEDAPAVAPLPALSGDGITFGCFNSAYKLSPTTLDRWAGILGAVPSSRLVLKSGEYGNAECRQRFHRLFAARGIDPARLDLRPGEAHPLAMMAAYGDIDIALDPTPYSGGLTTLEGLYMGVPVITAPGRRFGSRHSSVHLRSIGLDDWIAADGDGYVALAIAKAADIPALAELRAGLRRRLQQSPLMDGRPLAADLAGIVRELWRNACRRDQADAATWRGRSWDPPG